MQCRYTDAPVRRVELINVGNVKKLKGWLNKTWMELIQEEIDAKDLNKDIAR